MDMAKHPSANGIKLDMIIEDYGATLFQGALAHYVIQIQNPKYSCTEIEASLNNIHLPFDQLSVFFQIKFCTYDLIRQHLISQPLLSTPFTANHHVGTGSVK